MAHYLNIQSPVQHQGKEAFRLLSFSGHEEVSRLFSFQLDLLSPKLDIKPDDIVGKAVTFSVQDPGVEKPRFFHGFVSRLSAGSAETSHRSYQAEVVPWLWFLTRTSDCRIFSQKTVPQIIEEVFKDLGFAVYEKLKPSRSYPKWPYCVQYRETDFNFVSRLMEQEGIFYYFKHEQGKHTLMFGDAPSAWLPDSPSIRYEYSVEGAPMKESILHWTHDYQFVPGRFALSDSNFKDHPSRAEKTPEKLLDASSPGKANPKLFDPDKYEIFDYPGEYDSKDEGKELAKTYMEEEEAVYNTAQGTSYSQQLGPGHKFKLTEHKLTAENQEYVVTAIDHTAADSPEGQGAAQTYTNSFTCIPVAVSFRPARITRKPSIQGVQTAVVVGPPGSEINTDEHGRVQVQFFWDRRGTRLQEKQEEPAWLRVGQIIAGKSWGAMFIPRIGQEVIVTFVEGDPDWPMITGVVYNGEQTPPYNPKEEPTKSYIKTNSSQGGDGFNELRFEDKKGKERIFIHAQRNMDVRIKADSMERVGGNEHLHVGGIDGGKGNQSILIDGTKSEAIGGDLHFTCDSRKEKVRKGDSLQVGDDLQAKVGKKYAMDAGTEIHVKSGATMVLEAGVQLTLKVGGNFIDISPAGIAIQGTMVLINSGGAPGVGSGSNPDEAQPAKPQEADDAKTGQKSTPF